MSMSYITSSEPYRAELKDGIWYTIGATLLIRLSFCTHFPFFFFYGATTMLVLAFSTISFHLRWSCTCSAHVRNFIFFRPFLTSSSHQDLGLPAGLPVNGFLLGILFTMLVSGILFVCPNQHNLLCSGV